MHPHAKVIETFYQGFARRDAAAMATSYHPEIQFSDPVFPDLRGPRACAMWSMLCSRADAGLVVTFRNVTADDRQGTAHWDARYTFVKTGRPVRNSIDASFVFRDGKIIRHVDHFDFHAWSRMALGAAGLFLGWTPILRNAVRKQAAAQLDRFMATGT